MNFCQSINNNVSCGNLLYPTEIDNKLYMVCKFCEYKEEPKSTVIKKNVYKNNNVLNYGTNRYLIYENSYQRTKKIPCPNLDCPSTKDPALQEAVIYNNVKTLKITYTCCACNAEWGP